MLGNLNKTFDREDVRLKSLAVEGQVHHQSGNTAQAAKRPRNWARKWRASAARPDSETALEIARLMLATGDRENAVSLLQGEVKNSLDNTLALLCRNPGYSPPLTWPRKA